MLAQILFPLESLGSHSKKQPTQSPQNSQWPQVWFALWQLYDMADLRAVALLWWKWGRSSAETGEDQSRRLCKHCASPLAMAWWVCQDRACLPAGPQLCQIRPGTLVTSGGGDWHSAAFTKFFRSLLSQVKSYHELNNELASCFENIINWDVCGCCCLPSENLSTTAANILLICILFWSVRLQYNVQQT